MFKIRKGFQNMQNVYPELLEEQLYRDISTLTGSIHRHREKIKADILAATAGLPTPEGYRLPVRSLTRAPTIF